MSSDQFTLEREHNTSNEFNYEYRVGGIVCDAFKNPCAEIEKKIIQTPIGEHAYENIKLDVNKQLLLHKYFRSTGNNNSDYENLCKGCGYGVFDSRGQLCNFCECIVNGLKRKSFKDNDYKEEIVNNIYENICHKCGAIYESEKCSCCEKETTTIDSDKSLNITERELPKVIPNVKLSKSKSFKKHLNKFNGFIGSLGRARSSTKTAAHKTASSNVLCAETTGKRLEILHNVDGFDHVFRTQETFDIKRITALKQASCSDQHIYGRLKGRGTETIDRATSNAINTLSQSDDQLLTSLTEAKSLDALSTDYSTIHKKRPRISKIRLIAPAEKLPKSHSLSTVDTEKKSLYLTDSVCFWIRTLRKEVHNYHSFGVNVDDENITVCDPKSIPAKNVLIYCLTNSKTINVTGAADTPNSFHSYVTNCSNTDKLLQEKKQKNYNFGSEYELSDVSSNSNDSGNCDEIVTLRHQPDILHNNNPYVLSLQEISPATAQRVYDFKQSVMAKQGQVYESITAEVESIAAACSPKSVARQRAKRQAIYLKIDDAIKNNLEFENNNNCAKDVCESNNNDSNNYNSNNVNKQGKQTNNLPAELAEAAAQFASSQGLDSRQWARHAVTSTNKRCGIYERDSEFVNDILNIFETFLQQDTVTCAEENERKIAESLNDVEDQTFETVPKIELNNKISEINPEITDPNLISLQVLNTTSQLDSHDLHVSNIRSQYATTQIFDFVEIIGDLLISVNLNNVVIYYNKPLSAFLCCTNKPQYRLKYAVLSAAGSVRKFCRFYAYCFRNAIKTNQIEKITFEEDILENPENGSESAPKSGSDCVRLDHVLSVETENSIATNVEIVETNELSKTVASLCKKSEVKVLAIKVPLNVLSDIQNEFVENQIISSETAKKSTASNRPKLPVRDPKTALSSSYNKTPPIPARRETAQKLNMTVPSANSTPTHANSVNKCSDDDSIYQPIWKFKTVGEVQERYQADADYFELVSSATANIAAATSALITNLQSDSSLLPPILISNEIEDHGEWETDDEFMFATQFDDSEVKSDNCSLQSAGARSNSNTTGSTVTGFASSNSTLASVVTTSLMHHLFRNIGIFYSPTEPKIRAIVYDYDRVFAATYFASTTASNTDNSFMSYSNNCAQEQSPKLPPRTSSISHKNSSGDNQYGAGESECQPMKAKVTSTANKLQILPDSVQAWKFMLLDVNYIEDEEDMVVSKDEILRAQEIKDDINTRQTQQLNLMQRFKSASIGNLTDLPQEDDKKSITERMRNKLQRGVFKLNVRSPKSEKKSRGIFRRAEATSLYLEDGMKPKYPIFSAPLEQLELNDTTHPNVPRFVVDCVKYIEREDCIQQDGLYRASGNKVSIDELKQKLSESYIYDPKLLVTDDIHTLTSLLKLFFRELPDPLIPQLTYERLSQNLSDANSINIMAQAFEEVTEPNRSTLKFLIKHLTNVAAYSSENRMPASNLAIVWGPCLLSANQISFDIGRMNTLAKILIENYNRIFNENERLVS